MISDDDKTPPLLTFGGDNGHTPSPFLTPPPVFTPPPVLTPPPLVTPPPLRTRPLVVTPSPVSTPLPAATPRPTLTLKKPPLGRPAGSFSIAEMVEQITREVRRTARAELERRHAELRAELATDIRTAAGLGIAAIFMNAIAILAVVVLLALSRVLPAPGVALVLAALALVFGGAVRLGVRRKAGAR